MSMRRWFSFCFFLAVSAIAIRAGAQTSVFEYQCESPAQFGSTVLLQWKIFSGSTCNGTRIERSTDGISFLQIGSIEGVCGSTNSTERYSFIDENPDINKRNYYRITFNDAAITEVKSIFVAQPVANTILIIPNPVLQKATLYFENENRESLSLELYDLTGRRVMDAVKTNDSQYNFERNGLATGVYVFRVSDEQGVVASGRISLQ